MQSKYFVPRFWHILMIQTVYIIDSVVKIIVKYHVDRTQLSIHSVLFYNLINEYDTQDYTHLS